MSNQAGNFLVHSGETKHNPKLRTKMVTNLNCSISDKKQRKTEPEPQTSSSGHSYMRKNLDLKNKMVSPVPVIIQPTEEGSYQLPA